MLKKDKAAACIISAQPDVFEAVSAEEGGFLILDRGRDRDTLMVYLDDSLTMVKRADRSDHHDVKFGPDDRVFPVAADADARLRDGAGRGYRARTRRPAAALTPPHAAIRVRRTKFDGVGAVAELLNP